MEDERRGLSSSDFGTLLRRYRLAAGLSQEALAERARMSPDAISVLERGYRRKPQRETLSLLVGALALDGERRAEFETAARSALDNRRPSVLAGPWADAWPRSTINWSYDLLTAGEQCAFENLAVFCGGCTFEAARDVLGPTTSDDNATLSVLCSLVDKSLLEASTSGIEPRYRLLEPIREFAWERLGARAGQKSALQRHALSCLRVAEDLEAAYDLEPDSVWRELAFCERENRRAALELTLAGEGGCSRWSASGEHVGHGMGVPSAGRRPALVDARSRQDYRGNAGGNSRKHLPRSGPPCS